MLTSFAIMFIITLINHIGVIKKVEDYIHNPLPCYQELVFWSVLVFSLFTIRKLINSIVLALLLGYLSLWLDLLLHIIDYYYKKFSRKMIRT